VAINTVPALATLEPVKFEAQLSTCVIDEQWLGRPLGLGLQFVHKLSGLATHRREGCRHGLRDRLQTTAAVHTLSSLCTGAVSPSARLFAVAADYPTR
jgi:hypothetical protein